MKKLLALVLALVMTLGLATVGANAAYKDADSINYKEAVDVMTAIGVLAGDETGFRPADTLKRSEGAKIIAYLIAGQATADAMTATGTKYTDLPANHWAAGYMEYLSAIGVMGGLGDGRIDPDGSLSATAFAKMLLVALGYDAKIENFGGVDWQINVQRVANKVGLFSGNSSVVGSAAVTREEAALYALNTLKAPLVEYENKGSSIAVNGATIEFGAGNAQYMTSSAAGDRYVAIDNAKVNGNANEQIIEFAEEYYEKLVLNNGNGGTSTDDFQRPANTWTYKGAKVGTYAKTPTLTYTVKTTSDKVYDDLGLTSSITATVYEDGDADTTTFKLTNGDVSNKIGDQGVLTEVYKSVAADGTVVVKIMLINTYVGDVTSKVAATSVKKAYVTVTARGDLPGYASGNFDTEKFAVDDVVLYNVSYKGTSPSIKNVKAAEKVTGKVDGYTTNTGIKLDGTNYAYSAKVATQAGVTNVNTTVNCYLDTYGNVIDVAEGKDVNYAVVLKISNGAFSNEATLLFTDGTTKTVKLSADYGKNGIATSDIVSYTVKSGDQYSLTKLAAATDMAVNDYLEIKNGEYQFTFHDDNAADYTYTANGDTTFLVKTLGADGNAQYRAYDGIKNVAKLKMTAGGTVNDAFAIYCKTYGTLASIVYVDATSTANGALEFADASSDVIFIKGNNDGDSYTTGVGSYHQYDAIVNGELKIGDDGIMIDPAIDVEYDVTTSENTLVGSYALYDSVGYDANGVASVAKNSVIIGRGVYRETNSVIGARVVLENNNVASATMGKYAYYSADSSIKVAKVATDGTMSVGYGMGSVTNDTNDIIYFRVNAYGAVDYAVIVEVAGGSTTATTTTTYPVVLEAPNNVKLNYKVYDADFNEVENDGVNGIDNEITGKTAAGDETIGLPGSANGTTYYVVFEDSSENDGGASIYETRTVAFKVYNADQDPDNGVYTKVNNAAAAVAYGEADSLAKIELANDNNLPGTYSITIARDTLTEDGVTYGVFSFDETNNPIDSTKDYWVAKSDDVDYTMTVTTTTDGYENATVALDASNNMDPDVGNIWNTITFNGMYPGATVAVTHATNEGASLTNEGDAADNLVFHVAGTVTDYDYTVTTDDAAKANKIIVSKARGDVSGATVDSVKFFQLGSAVIADASGGGAKKADLSFAKGDDAIADTTAYSIREDTTILIKWKITTVGDETTTIGSRDYTTMAAAGFTQNATDALKAVDVADAIKNTDSESYYLTIWLKDANGTEVSVKSEASAAIDGSA